MDENYNEHLERDVWEAQSQQRDEWLEHREWVREQHADRLLRDAPVKAPRLEVRKAA